MKKSALLALLLSLVVCGAILASPHNEEKEHGHGRHGRGAHDKAPPPEPRRAPSSLSEETQTQMKIHAEACGSCHFLYPPQLLPIRSWEKILAGAADHFGNALALDEKDKNTLRDYLTRNAAERSDWECSRKILSSSQGDPPERITKTPYFQKKHRKLAQKASGQTPSLLNCPACHPGADQGHFGHGKHGRKD